MTDTGTRVSRSALPAGAAAHQHGKWVHMGRVNSARRMEWAAAIGCDSVDGTSYVRFTDTHLPAALAQVIAPIQGVLAA